MIMALSVVLALSNSCPEWLQVGGECPPNPSGDQWEDKGSRPQQSEDVPLDDRGMRLCNDPEIIEQALKSRSEGKFGHIDKTWISLMVLDHAEATGVDNKTGGKYCRAVFTCDIAAAREVESQNLGPHPLTKFCFAINQGFEAGSPYYINYHTYPNGEGGQVVDAYHNYGDPF